MTRFFRFVKTTHFLSAVFACIFGVLASTSAWGISSSGLKPSCVGSTQYWNYASNSCETCPTDTSVYGSGAGKKVIFCGYGAMQCNFAYGYALTASGCAKDPNTSTWASNQYINMTYATAAGGFKRCCLNDNYDYNYTVQQGNTWLDGCESALPNGATCSKSGQTKGSASCPSGYYLGAYGGCWPIASHPDYDSSKGSASVIGKLFYCSDPNYYRMVVMDPGGSEASGHNAWINGAYSYHGWHCQPCFPNFEDVDEPDGDDPTLPYYTGVRPSDLSEYFSSFSESTTNKYLVNWRECRTIVKIPYNYFSDDGTDATNTSGCYKASDGLIKFRWKINPDSSDLSYPTNSGQSYSVFQPFLADYTNIGQRIGGGTTLETDFMSYGNQFVVSNPDEDTDSGMYPKAGHYTDLANYGSSSYLSDLIAEYANSNYSPSFQLTMCPMCTGATYSSGSPTSTIASCSTAPENATSNSDHTGWVCNTGYTREDSNFAPSLSCVKCPYYGGQDFTNIFTAGIGTNLSTGTTNGQGGPCYTASNVNQYDDHGIFRGQCTLDTGNWEGQNIGFVFNTTCGSDTINTAITNACSTFFSNFSSGTCASNVAQNLSPVYQNISQITSNKLGDLGYLQLLSTLLENAGCTRTSEILWF